MNIVKYDPAQYFTAAFDKLAEDFLGGTERAVRTFNPRVDIKETKDAVEVSLEVPGVEESELKVELHKGVLSISGEKKAESHQEGEGYYRSERLFGTFRRSFSLPEELDGEHIKAEHKNGVLTITLPKKPEEAPKAISIAYKK